jgi:alanyl-tRNA synthetase
MNQLTSGELRSRYLEFFRSKGHAVIPSASLIPENDPTVLFTTAGMHPLVPYLLGEKHPAGTRLTNVQKCIRTNDIDEVGDASHLTFFEMLGNWSLGDYFKAEAIAWSWEFLTSPEWLGIDPARLAVSVFAGDEDAPRDEESAALWRECGLPAERIFYLPKKNNWWGPAGQTGPCGPDTEMFIVRDQAPCGPSCSPACDCGRYLEIWNDVFMQYNKKADGTFEPLRQRNVDTGMGLERTITVLQGKNSVYETDMFAPILGALSELSGREYGESPDITRAMRIVSDHIRTATFILGDPKGVTPSNVDQGYVLRRIIRRAVRFGRRLALPEGFASRLAGVIIDRYADVYPELSVNAARITDELDKEERRFAQTLDKGEREFEKVVRYMKDTTVLNGKTAFRLYDTFGFPIELTCEMAAEQGLTVDIEGYEAAFRRHQEVSSAGAQRFKGGLADNTEATARLHTATHLLNAALRALLSGDIEQRGSNITPERLRFDFNFPRKVEPEELARIEEWVNAAIAADVPITCDEMSVGQAQDTGAVGVFSSRYGDMVKVFTMGEYSREICGGPHAARTGELGVFKIVKEQAVSAGVRRIRAILLDPEQKG